MAASRDPFVDDIVAMTRQAARDGLPLTTVFADLRLVLDLAPSDDIPAPLLRACASSWARTQQELSAGPRSGLGGVRTCSRGDLESLLWGAPGSPADELPSSLVVVELRSSRLAASTALLGPEDLLHATAQLLSALLDCSSERVMLVREDGEPERPWWVAGLVTGDDERVDRAVTRVTALASVNEDLVVSVHRLSGHPDGVLSSLRCFLDARD
ncbi:hypothetical protein GCM10023350_12410 [Nocardioides endophyticus]|uniref:CdaR GGDEF-like domain-containing protein n=1 Tax=Nocardioides endophyticus TaxID=1353775 RepID=A0ABP8YN38_9ACTN